MSNTSKEKEKWIKQKSIGKTKYILIYGILLWGISYSAIYGTLTMFFNPNPVNYDINQIITRYIAYGLMGGLGGIMIGNLQWNMKVKKFGK